MISRILFLPGMLPYLSRFSPIHHCCLFVLFVFPPLCLCTYILYNICSSLVMLTHFLYNCFFFSTILLVVSFICSSDVYWLYILSLRGLLILLVLCFLSYGHMFLRFCRIWVLLVFVLDNVGRVPLLIALSPLLYRFCLLV